jgi:hypothetical protein
MRLLSAIVWATFGVGAFAGYAALAGPAPEAHVCYFGQIVELTLPPNTREGVYVADPVGVQWGPPRPAMQRQCLLPGQKIFVEAAGPEALVREVDRQRQADSRRTVMAFHNPIAGAHLRQYAAKVRDRNLRTRARPGHRPGPSDGRARG